jgi:membrane protein implicated in regulation of membrane protease activity
MIVDDGISFWHWWALGLALVVVEMLAPGIYFLWMGIAAALVGFLLLALPDLSWQVQVLAFAVLSVGSVAIGRWVVRRYLGQTDQPRLNRRGEQYVGRVFNLEQPIVNGTGKIRVDDTTWKITGPDCDAGAKVLVTGADGVVLRVERTV